MRNSHPVLRARSILAGILLLTGSCAGPSPLAPSGRDDPSARAASASARAIRAAAGTLEGTIGPGAHYVISVPDSWNGDLVLYAHGYTAPVFPVGLPPGEDALVDGLRSLALQGGFAFAYSSYSQTGLGLKDAAQRTSQLGNLFSDLVGEPNRTFLVGTSFGALAAVKLVEDHPGRYAGLLTLSGMVGGVRAEVDYVSNVRVLFDYFYPGVLRGSLYQLPEDFDLQRDIVDPVTAALGANPQPALALTQVAQTPIPFSNGTELGESVIQALVLQAVELQDLLERTHGQGFFDNTSTVYAGPLPPELLADLNARVARYTAGPAAVNLLEKYYDPTGDLRVPMVGMHTTLDPVVPLFHETAYESRVQADGLAANLHRVTIERYGHVAFAREEIAAGFGRMLELAAQPPAP